MGKTKENHRKTIGKTHETMRETLNNHTPKRIDKKVAKLSLSQEFLNCLGRILESISYFLRIS